MKHLLSAQRWLQRKYVWYFVFLCSLYPAYWYVIIWIECLWHEIPNNDPLEMELCGMAVGLTPHFLWLIGFITLAYQVSKGNKWADIIARLGVLLTCTLILLFVMQIPSDAFPVRWSWSLFLALMLMINLLVLAGATFLPKNHV